VDARAVVAGVGARTDVKRAPGSRIPRARLLMTDDCGLFFEIQ
jgi:hypothetical protein